MTPIRRLTCYTVPVGRKFREYRREDPEYISMLYQKLKPYLATTRRTYIPYEWDFISKLKLDRVIAEVEEECIGGIIETRVTHFRPVRWMPELELGWRRLTLEEFCAYYGIKLQGEKDESDSNAIRLC